MPDHDRIQTRAIQDVAFLECAEQHRIAMAGAQVVIDDRFHPRPSEQLAGVAADIARATGHQDFHIPRPYHGSAAASA